MKFDLKNLNPGTEFDLGEGVKLWVRTINSEALAEIDEKTTTKKFQMRKGLRVPIVETNEKLRRHLTWDYIIVNWEGIEGDDGSPLECNFDNKIALCNGSPWFLSKLLECLNQLNVAMEGVEELETKN